MTDWMSRFLYNKMGHLPACAHNRYWSSDTAYAKQNGGSYNFIVEPIVSLPTDQVRQTMDCGLI